MTSPSNDPANAPIRWHFQFGNGEAAPHFALTVPLSEHGHVFCVLFRDEGGCLREISRLRCDGDELANAREAAARCLVAEALPRQGVYDMVDVDVRCG